MPVKGLVQEPTTKQINTDFEVQSLNEAYDNSSGKDSMSGNLLYIPAGVVFGILLVKSEVISWFRIQEMFRLQSFHMYGILGSAIVVGIISVFIIKIFKIRSIDG